LEGVGLAVNAFRKIYKRSKGGNTRGGFFLGDGAGVGKGRQISSVIRHAVCTNKPRHLWLSVSRSLIDDARRDLDDVGLVGVKLHSAEMLSSINKGLGASQDGVLFVTYQMLISSTRIDQIVKWLAPKRTEETFSGCIIFDECHKAKNIGGENG
jgi:superfamily II DNA or RNA helicase